MATPKPSTLQDNSGTSVAGRFSALKCFFVAGNRSRCVTSLVNRELSHDRNYRFILP